MNLLNSSNCDFVAILISLHGGMYPFSTNGINCIGKIIDISVRGNIPQIFHYLSGFVRSSEGKGLGLASILQKYLKSNP